MLPQFANGSFESTSGPALKNIDIGFIPAIFECWGATSAAGDVVYMRYVHDLGSAKGWKMQALIDSGSTGNYSVSYAAASMIATYDPGYSQSIPTRWTASTAYVVGNTVFPKAIVSPSNIQLGTYYYFECTAAGSSGASEPTWTTDGTTTVTDSGVTWTPIKMGGTGTDISPAVLEVKPKGVTIPAALLKASTYYYWVAYGFV